MAYLMFSIFFKSNVAWLSGGVVDMAFSVVDMAFSFLLLKYRMHLMLLWIVWLMLLGKVLLMGNLLYIVIITS